MREVVLDTETTGLDPLNGHRIVEIGCVELVNHVASGRTFHQYVNPERDMPVEAFNVHGLSAEFLTGHPVFADVADAFVDFVGDAPLVIHNASFDMGFINAELARLRRPSIPLAQAVDTVAMARRRFPGAGASLDALCRRFQIDISHRDLHGALKDAQLLAEVYLELIGGRQPDLELAAGIETRGAAVERTARPPRAHAPGPGEDAAHRAFLEKLSDPVWSL
ncbi:MAG: DNA polymerase III subunit epsilon [Rhodospirillales bacterium CG15_BIG_FIL_POST_REV_8_21_14_020_66_15]|nr:MAG: DNA polymerase III subunit epsilon [Rhodospirillales bacterium CG15_BIG_FIL_POST_REV_8_21_14_020_66_15]